MSLEGRLKSCFYEELSELKARLREEGLARRRLEEQLLPMSGRLTELESEAQRLGKELQQTQLQRGELVRQIGERQQSVAKLQEMCRKEQETRKRLDEELKLNKRLQLQAHQEVESELRSRLRRSGDLEALSDGEVSEQSPTPSEPMSLQDEKENQQLAEASVGCELSKLASERLGGLGLSQRDLSELKALKQPPVPVRMLMEICCVLFDIPPERHRSEPKGKMFQQDYWEPARRFLLSDSFFVAKLRALSPSELSEPQRKRIRRYLKSPELALERVSNCSRAAVALLSWVRSLVEPGIQS